MVCSGTALVIFDSRIIHRWITSIKNRFRRSRTEENVELGTNTQSQAEPQFNTKTPEPTPIQIDENSEHLTSLRNRQQGQQEIVREPSSPRVSAENVMIPYSIWTGLGIFAAFVVSFVVVMVVRGVVHDAPIPFEFFANMYLAGFFPNFCIR